MSFAEIQPPPDEPPPDSSVKHVQVRSNVDILSELDKLRKISTQKPASPSHEGEERRGRLARRPSRPPTRNHKKDVTRCFEILVPREALSKSRHVTIELYFADDSGAAIGPEKRFAVDLAGAKDLQKLLLSLKFNVRAE